MIHQTAIVDAAARIAEDVEIGPYSIVGAEVEIGAEASLDLDTPEAMTAAGGKLTTAEKPDR